MPRRAADHLTEDAGGWKATSVSASEVGVCSRSTAVAIFFGDLRFAAVASLAAFTVMPERAESGSLDSSEELLVAMA